MKSLSLVLLSTTAATALSFFAVSAFAGQPPAPMPSPSGTPAISVKITSFGSTSTDPNDHSAEVCGVVTVSSPALPRTGNYIAVTVTSDPKYNPGPYTVLVDPTGAFCVVVLTQTGTVEASAWLPSNQMNATSGVVSLGLKR